MYILKRPFEGENFTLSLRFLISSMPRLDAPSISITSMLEPAVISLQELQTLQGFTEGPFSQLMALENILAVEVLPMPLGPANK